MPSPAHGIAPSPHARCPSLVSLWPLGTEWVSPWGLHGACPGAHPPGADPLTAVLFLATLAWPTGRSDLGLGGGGFTGGWSQETPAGEGGRDRCHRESPCGAAGALRVGSSPGELVSQGQGAIKSYPTPQPPGPSPPCQSELLPSPALAALQEVGRGPPTLSLLSLLNPPRLTPSQAAVTRSGLSASGPPVLSARHPFCPPLPWWLLLSTQVSPHKGPLTSL